MSSHNDGLSNRSLRYQVKLVCVLQTLLLDTKCLRSDAYRGLEEAGLYMYMSVTLPPRSSRPEKISLHTNVAPDLIAQWMKSVGWTYCQKALHVGRTIYIHIIAVAEGIIFEVRRRIDP